MDSSFNWLFLRRLSIQNHPKLSITEKRRNNAKYLTWNTIRLTFAKKKACETLLKAYSSTSTTPVKSHSNSITYSCWKICSWSRRPKTILEIRKKVTFLSVINKPNIYKFFKDFILTSKRKLTGRQFLIVDISPNILKYRDQWGDLLIWKTRIFQTYIKMLN